MSDRTTCCWTHCDNEQGIGTWTEINGETLPVCEEHWYGNWTKEKRQLQTRLDLLRERVAAIAALASADATKENQ